MEVCFANRTGPLVSHNFRRLRSCRARILPSLGSMGGSRVAHITRDGEVKHCLPACRWRRHARGKHGSSRSGAWVNQMITTSGPRLSKTLCGQQWTKRGSKSSTALLGLRLVGRLITLRLPILRRPPPASCPAPKKPTQWTWSRLKVPQLSHKAARTLIASV